MPVKSIRVREHSTAKAGPPEVVLAGNDIALRAAKLKQLEKLAQEVDKLTVDLKAMGCAALAEFNCASFPGEPIPSVKLKDKDGQTAALVTMQDRYSTIPSAKFNAHVFEELGLDEAEYVVETAKVKFDGDFFLDEHGEFNQGAYDATVIALEQVANLLGKPHPLSAEKVIQPKADFHVARWAIPAEQQVALTEALPSTITLKSTEA